MGKVDVCESVLTGGDSEDTVVGAWRYLRGSVNG